MAPLRLLTTFLPRNHLTPIVEGHWRLFPKYAKGEVVRKIDLTSQNSASFYSKIEVFGEFSGRVGLICRFPNQAIYGRVRLWHKLPQMGIYWESTNEIGLMLGVHESRSLQEAQRIFKAFTSDNRCNQTEFDLISSLLQEGDWRVITPLKPFERLPIRPVPSYNP